MKNLFILATLFAFVASATFSFAKPEDKDLKLNRGQVQSSINKVDKVLDPDDEDVKGKKPGKKDKKDKDSKLDKSVKKESRKLIRKALK